MRARRPHLALLAFALSHSLAFAATLREQVEADWARQDAAQLGLLANGGTITLGARRIQWPGVRAEGGLGVPRHTAPALDGSLADACWPGALRIEPAAPDQPTLRLCHDGERLFLGVSIPTDTEARYQGDPTAADAAGAVDGVKNGRYAFHTDRTPNPWWQVDLGGPQPVARIVVYNRLDYQPGLHNADNLLILTSDDGVKWTLRHDNKGRYFGGVGSKEPPLEVKLEGVRARFVRLQVRSTAPVWFHLDEVEVYGPADPKKNLALRRPARQSSLSQWSRRARAGSALCTLGQQRLGLSAAGAVTLNGAALPAGSAALARKDGRTSVEVALPATTGEFQSPGRPATRLVLGGAWTLLWHPLPHLGFGRNRIHLEVQAAAPLDPPVELTVETVALTREGVQRHTVVRRRAAGPEAGPVEFRIAHEGAAAILVTAQQGEAVRREGRAFFIPPVDATLRRAHALAEDFGLPASEELNDLGTRAKALAAREEADGPDPDARAALCRETRWLARRVAFQNPRLALERLLFVKRITQQTYPDVCLNHMPWCSPPGGDICVLTLATGEVRNVINGTLGPGHVHGMDLWWDADRVVFGYAKQPGGKPPEGWRNRSTSYRLRRTVEPTHLFEIHTDGTGVKQLTDGEWSDIDPTYLPNGHVAFASERCATSLQCNELDKDETSCNLYIVRPDGTGIRRLSVSKDGDYLPHTLADGTIGYTRWEYQERGWAHIQSIWTVRPDGTGADALFKQHINNPWALEDARSIPASHKLVAIATGHHTLAAGPVVVVDPRAGMNNPNGIRIVTPGVWPPEGGMAGSPVPEGGVADVGGFYMTPWPLSEKHFLASYTYGSQTDPTGYALYLIDVHGTRELVYRDPAISCSMPIPLRPRPRPPILMDTTEPGQDFATCAVNDVARGTEGVDPKAIRYLRISQRIAWPYCNTFGGQRYEPDVKGVMINWTPARVLGTVPVEADGSAHFIVPVDTPVYFQLLDENQMELRRMRSFISFQPGERRSCSGCHETRAWAPPPTRTPLALLREPSVPDPPPWGDHPISFLRDVQPVLDRHCTRCHTGLKPTGGLDLSPGLTARHNRAYDTMLQHRLIARSNVGDDAKVTPALAFGSHRSKLVAVLRKKPHTERARLSPEDWVRLVTWIDANGPYHGGFINKRRKPPPYDLPADRELIARIAAIHATRCAACHKPADITRPDWIDLREPRNSLFLTAPLAKRAGGLERCREVSYNEKSDTGYQAVLRLVEAAVQTVWQRPRRDVRALQRPEHVAATAARPPE